MKIQLANIRITGQDKNYWLSQMQKFADKFNDTITEVQFGRQDIRGGISITLFDNRHCIPKQKFFSSKGEMLGYIEGINNIDVIIHNEWENFTGKGRA